MQLLFALAAVTLALPHPADPVRRQLVLGRSAEGRPIKAVELGNPRSPRQLLVVGCIHGTETAGIAIARRLARGRAPHNANLWIVPDLNPDGVAERHRQNGRGVDLNRNFASEWRPIGAPWNAEYAGPHPFSEPETRLARRLVNRLRPDVTIWFHQPQSVVRAWAGSVPAARRFARLAGARFARIRWPSGTAPNWQNHRFPDAAAFVVELPPGRLPRPAVARYASAVRALASGSASAQ